MTDRNPGADKPFAPSSEENKEPILGVIGPLFQAARRLLEVGSGTGQHAVHFGAAMPHLRWQTTEVAENLPGIRAWLNEARLPNLPPPFELDVRCDWPSGPFDAVFSANTSHIMPMDAVSAMFEGIGRVLEPGGRFALYGPFNVGGRYTSDGNRTFDAWLRSQDPAMGLRDVDDLKLLGESCGLEFVREHQMPVNNLTLVWTRRPH